ncbi:MAG: FUSC family protein [Acidocella sp.]|nr:FUSC family protein [Acidocella sp.]
MPSLPKNLPFNWNVGGVSLAEGVRAGMAVAATVLAGDFLGLPHFGLAALGALLTCFADPGGPVRRRAPAVLAFAVLAGISYGFFGLLRGAGIWVAVPVAALAIFCTSYARIYGQGGLQVGNLLSVVIVLALDTPATSIAAAAGQGANLFAGAFWAASLTLVIWQIHPYQPARDALAEVALKLSQFSKDLTALAQPGYSTEAFEAHAALHRRSVREAIETARGVALDTFRRRGLVSQRAAQVTVRLQTLEQIFGGLIALSDVFEQDESARAHTARPLRLVAGWLAALGPDIRSGAGLDAPKKQVSLVRLHESVEKLPFNSPAAHILTAITENFAVLMTVSSPAGQAMSGVAVLPLSVRILTPIRSNCNFAAAPMRHALRTACIVTPALAVTMIWHEPFSHWATITMIFCLQPYFSATWVRAAERIGGTALGGALAAAIGLLAQNQVTLALTMLPLTIFAFAIRGVSYAAFQAALTPMVVLLIEQIVPGTNELNVALSRIGYTLLGGTLAVLGNLLLWPSFEHFRIEASITQALNAHAGYVRAVFTAMLDGGANVDSARRAAGMASNNLEASLARALLEPHRGRDAAIERGAIVDAALRRMAGRLSVLMVDRPEIPKASHDLWWQWREFLTQSLTLQTTPRPRLPPGPGSDALVRLARQVELITGP